MPSVFLLLIFLGKACYFNLILSLALRVPVWFFSDLDSQSIEVEQYLRDHLFQPPYFVNIEMMALKKKGLLCKVKKWIYGRIGIVTDS